MTTEAQAPAKAFYSIPELQARWGVGRSTVYREIARGRIKPVHIGGQIRFAAAEVARYERVA